MTDIPNKCPDCGAEVNYIKSGISKKTGRSYPAFFACGMKCGWTEREFQQEPPKKPDIVENLATKEDVGMILDALRKVYAEIGLIKKITDRFNSEDKIVVYPSDEEQSK